MKKINKLYAFVCIALFLVFAVVSLWFIEKNEKARIDYVLSQQLSTLESYYKALTYKQSAIADATFKETIEYKKFMDIFLDANKAKEINDIEKLNQLRKEAQALLDAKYNIYKIKGVLQYHFVFPDNKVFLRMHKPSKFGDDLTDVRTDFDTVNKTLKAVRGFAQGRTAHGFRNVYPILNQDNIHLGAIEISFSSEQLQNHITEINQLHTHFLVNKNIFKSHAWTRNDLILKYAPSAENENFMLTMTNQHIKEKCITENQTRLKPIKEQIDTNMLKDEPFSLYTLFKASARIVSFYPIRHNVTNDVVAWIVSYKENIIINDILKSSMRAKIFMVVFLATIAFFFYYLLVQRSLLNQLVEEKTESLRKTNRELEESEEELQLLNENLQHMVDEEVSKNKAKDHLILEQSKMAALGEMIGNIAHQWRQPLSVISSSATGMIVKNELNMLDKESINTIAETINDNAQYLSKTIDDFRNFIRGDSKNEQFNLKEQVDSFLSLVESSIKKYGINVIIKVPDDIFLFGLKNELNQCFLNLFNNSKDAMLEYKIKEKCISIEAYKVDGKFFITFHDNGGGIDEKIINKIFEPYFTTKHQSIGTGLGLSMVYRLITQGMNGIIHVSNENIEYNNTSYTGAKFVIEIDAQ